MTTQLLKLTKKDLLQVINLSDNEHYISINGYLLGNLITETDHIIFEPYEPDVQHRQRPAVDRGRRDRL